MAAASRPARGPARRETGQIVGGWPRPGAVDRPARVPWRHSDRSSPRCRRRAVCAAPGSPSGVTRCRRRSATAGSLAALLQVPRRLGAHRQDPRRGRQRRTPLRAHPHRATGHQRVVRRRRRARRPGTGCTPPALDDSSPTGRCAGGCSCSAPVAHLVARGRPSRRAAEILRITGRPTWRFAFLQHGVTQMDLSAWLNRRELDLFVVSTEDELASVIGDGTGHTSTPQRRRAGTPGCRGSTACCGRRASVDVDGRDLVVLAPTWRKWLAGDVDEASLRRDVDPAIWTPNSCAAGRRSLGRRRSPRRPARSGRRVAFMPHPNFQPLLPDLDLPPDVLRFTLRHATTCSPSTPVRPSSSPTTPQSPSTSPRSTARSSTSSSTGTRCFGGHISGGGYFDYERDGFGPVALDSADGDAAIVEAIDRGPHPSPEYQARIDRTFTNRDGDACARVVAAIEELGRPHRPAGRARPRRDHGRTGVRADRQRRRPPTTSSRTCPTSSPRSKRSGSTSGGSRRSPSTTARRTAPGASSRTGRGAGRAS